MPGSPHDKLFREALGDPVNAAAELRSVLPPGLLAHAELGSLMPLPGSFVDEALAGSESDLLYSLRFAGRETLLYVLFEHKSQPDRWSGLQLLRYMVRIWERCLTSTPAPQHLPPIVPILLHHSENGFRGSALFDDLLDPVVGELPELRAFTPRFQFLLDDISHASDAELGGRALNAFGNLALIFLRDARSPGRLLASFESLAGLFEQLLSAPDGKRALSLLFQYLSMASSRLDRDALRHAVRGTIPAAEELIMTLAEQWQKEGFQKGLETGLEKGLEQGLQQLRSILLQQLETKFGPVPLAQTARLDAANEAALRRFAQRILIAGSLDDVFAD